MVYLDRRPSNMFVLSIFVLLVASSLKACTATTSSSTTADIPSIVLPGHDGSNLTATQPLSNADQFRSNLLSQMIPYQIPGTTLLIYMQSQPQAAIMQINSFDHVVDMMIQDFDQQAAASPLVNKAYLKTVDDLVLSVDRRFYKRAFTFGGAVHVLLALKSQMARLNYQECTVRIFETQPARGPWSVPIGYVQIDKLV